MKYRDLVEKVLHVKQPVKSADCVFVNVVNGFWGAKTSQALQRAERGDGRMVFVAAPGRREVSFANFKALLLERNGEYGDLDCFLRADDSDVILPLKNAYVDARCDGLVLEADYSEFDRNDPQIVKEVLYDAHYGNRPDAIRELFHVLACLKMGFAQPTREIRYEKTGPDRARIRAKVKGTATGHYDLFNHSFFVPDKNSYIKAGIKW